MRPVIYEPAASAVTLSAAKGLVPERRCFAALSMTQGRQGKNRVPMMNGTYKRAS